MDPKQENEALKREIAALRAELTATQSVLAEKDAQLQRILNTIGWRLLSRYGRFKHGVLLPALDAVRRRRDHVAASAAGEPPPPETAAPERRGEMSYAEWATSCEAVRYDAG